MNADLHSHSIHSDGVLLPAQVVELGARHGVRIMALTDHDHTAGWAESRAAGAALGVRVMPGVEVSCQWRETSIHVVGLGFNPGDAPFEGFLARIRSGRDRRAERMAQSLEALGFEGAHEAALRHAGNPQLISRTHFARFLVDLKVARSVQDVFRYYLGEGKPGFVPHVWPALSEVVGQIRTAGGVAVLAHPGRYRLGRADLDQLVEDFSTSGGVGIEVLSGHHERAQARRAAQLALRFGLAASRGCDFHAPGGHDVEPGCLPPLDGGLRPVWELPELERWLD